MSEMENQDYFIALVAKGKKLGHLSLEQVYAVLPNELRDEEHFVEEILMLLESHHGILVSEDDMEKDLLENIEEEQSPKAKDALDHPDGLDVEETLIDHDLEEDEEIEEEIDEEIIDNDLADFSGISTPRRG
ncbi:MAG: RNA polymerase sigma factor region1.1 domain-containing protein, partial [Sphaerochaetaceae bacterium]|nr:RNA polymerase sigma factor region1.1 domain-containing protein [Sphaerochaetaceae bacterium]